MTSSFQVSPIKFSVLLVEDDLDIIDIIQRTAKVSFPEAEFVPISTFEEAVLYLYSLEGKGPRLVMLDIFLTGNQTGLDFLKLLKEHPVGKAVPTVVISSSDSNLYAKEAYRLGAASYFVKPFSAAEWREMLTLFRHYWYQTVALPPTYFENQSELTNKYKYLFRNSGSV